MRPPYSTLTPPHIYDHAATLLGPYLQWHNYGPNPTSASKRSTAVRPKRHDPLSCLCHGLYRAPGPAFYCGPDPSRVRHRLVEVLKRLLHLLRQAGIRPRLLLLDRGLGAWAVRRLRGE